MQRDRAQLRSASAQAARSPGPDAGARTGLGGALRACVCLQGHSRAASPETLTGHRSLPAIPAAQNEHFRPFHAVPENNPEQTPQFSKQAFLTVRMLKKKKASKCCVEEKPSPLPLRVSAGTPPGAGGGSGRPGSPAWILGGCYLAHRGRGNHMPRIQPQLGANRQRRRWAGKWHGCHQPGHCHLLGGAREEPESRASAGPLPTPTERQGGQPGSQRKSDVAEKVTSTAPGTDQMWGVGGVKGAAWALGTETCQEQVHKKGGLSHLQTGTVRGQPHQAVVGEGGAVQGHFRGLGGLRTAGL